MTLPDDMRIGDAERDAVTAALHEHFAAGRLDRQELDERLGGTLAAKTQGQLKKITADLPGPNGLPEPAKRRPGHPGPHWAHGHPMHRHRHGPGPAFPLLLIAFVILAFTAGPGTAVFTLLQFALLIWIIRALVLAARSRFRDRARPHERARADRDLYRMTSS